MRVVAVDFNIRKLGRESRVSAMVRPVSVDYLDFALGRVALFALEVISYESQILFAHSKSRLFVILCYLIVAHIYKALDYGYGKIELYFLLERSGNFHTAFSALNGVDNVLLDFLEALIVRTFDCIEFCALNQRTLCHRQKLYALHRAVRSLVVLSGKVLDYEQFIFLKVGQLLVEVVYGLFAEDSRLCLCINLFVQILYIVSYEFSYFVDVYSYHVFDVGGSFLSRYVVTLFFLNENSLYHNVFLNILIIN